MDVLALVVASLSAASAIGAVVYVRRSWREAARSADAAEKSASAARQSAWLQSENDWRARSPSFEVEWAGELSRQGEVRTYGATLRSRGPEAYEEIHLRLLEPPAGDAPVLYALTNLATNHQGQRVELGGIDVGERCRFGVVPEFEDSGAIRGGVVDLQITARTPEGDPSGADEWTVPIQFEVPSAWRL